MITFQTPEERWASTLWEVPIFFGHIGVKSLIFVPSGPIFPDGGILRLLLRDEKETLGTLVIDQDIKRFQVCYFDVIPHGIDYRILILRKDMDVGKNVAIPGALVQVESW